MKVFIFVLLAVATQAFSKAGRAYLYDGITYPAHHVGAYAAPDVTTYAASAVAIYAAPAVTTYAAAVVPQVETEVTSLNKAVPVSVGGYKAVAGNNGELMGAVHEVPTIFVAVAPNKQDNDASQGSLTIGTDAVAKVTGHSTVATPSVHYGKREAEANPLIFEIFKNIAHHISHHAAQDAAYHDAKRPARARASRARAVLPVPVLTVSVLTLPVPVLPVAMMLPLLPIILTIMLPVPVLPVPMMLPLLPIILTKMLPFLPIMLPSLPIILPIMLPSSNLPMDTTYIHTAPTTFNYTAPAIYGYPDHGLGYTYKNDAYGYAGFPLNG